MNYFVSVEMCILMFINYNWSYIPFSSSSAENNGKLNMLIRYLIRYEIFNDVWKLRERKRTNKDNRKFVMRK